MARLQVDELLDMITAGDDMDAKIAKCEEICKSDASFWELLKMSVDPKLKMQNLPVGFPAKYRPENTLPSGVADTNLKKEHRRVKNFLPGQPLDNITPKQRAEMWLQTLNGLHWKEAEILTFVKDQTLCEKYPDLWVILPAIGIATCINTDAGIADLPSVETVTEPLPETAAPAKIAKAKKRK